VFWDRFILTLDSGGGALVRADPVSGESDKLWQVGRVLEGHEVLPCPIWQSIRQQLAEACPQISGPPKR